MEDETSIFMCSCRGTTFHMTPQEPDAEEDGWGRSVRRYVITCSGCGKRFSVDLEGSDLDA